MTVTLYVPAFEELKLLTDGVADAEVNPFGPVQEYVAETVGAGKDGLNETERLAVEPLVMHLSLIHI